jgi:tyrosine-protein phosphatase SIW14
MALSNFGIVAPGRLYRAAQPDAKGFQDLVALGVTLAVKLDGDGEYPHARENAEFPGPVWVEEVATFQPDRVQVVHLATRLDQALASGLVAVVHFLHGRDRTGLVIGAWRLLFAQWTLAQVLEERQLYGAGWLIDLADREILLVLRAIAASAS